MLAWGVSTNGAAPSVLSTVAFLQTDARRTPMSLSPSSFAILGAGLMGRLLAVELARQGHRVEIYDAGSPQAEQSAATVAAAMQVFCAVMAVMAVMP